MKKLIPFGVILAAVCALLALSTLVAVPEAQAADIRNTVLTSADAGATQTITVQARTTVSLQCTYPACYRLSADAGIPDCTKDPILPAATAPSQAANPYSLETGGMVYLNAYALDAGNPDCRVFTRTKNPPTTGK